MKTKDKKFEVDSLDIETINELEQMELRGGRATVLRPADDTQVGCNVDQCNCQSCRP